ncbi:ABC transporter substrate-binding protein [Candidatus Roseilinea sp. NK_OTU-006]|nr:ABC transporter substrate-binding protein [Candidatus Roseilinea sp. NK_OTU-006]
MTTLSIAGLLVAACAAPPVTTAPTVAPPPAPAATPTAGAPQPAESPTAAPTETPAAADMAITLTDALGREVTLPTPPQRIVLTGRGLFMIADAIYTFPEAGQRIVGMGQTAQGSGNFIKLIDPGYADKATLERDAGAEQVAALQPDLVIVKSTAAEATGKPIEALGIPVVYVDFETPAQYYRDLVILGKVFGDEARAQEVIDFYQAKVAEIKKAVAGADKPRVLLLYYNDRDGAVSFNVPPLNWIQTEMVQIAGGEPVWASIELGRGWTQVTLEQIAAWDPDQVFVVSYFKNPSEVVADLKADANWQALRAAKAGRLYAFPADLYSWDQPDTRWILGLMWLAGRIHPDRFSGLDIEAEARAFYQVLYGLDEDFFASKIKPTFKGDLP